VQTLDTSENIVTLTIDRLQRYRRQPLQLVGRWCSHQRYQRLQNLYRAQHPGYPGNQHPESGRLLPEIHEDAFDKLTMLVQQVYGWWSGLALKKPSWLANYYDALNNRIRNLRDPSQAQDAATKGYIDSEIACSIITHGEQAMQRLIKKLMTDFRGLYG
jgi:hypothetical protein